MPPCRVSTAVPRTKPEMMRPPEMQSSMAISSAMRMGSLTAITLPRMAILVLRVTLAMTAASMLTAGFMHQYEAWCSLDMMPSNPFSSAHVYCSWYWL